MTRLAVMRMYDTPGLRAAYSAWWAHLAASLREDGVSDVPDFLSEDLEAEQAWTDADLLLAQTCGYPMMTRLRGRVRYVATPCYEAPGCEGPYYCSLLLVRAEDPARELADLRDHTAAYNSAGSQSGYNVLRAMIAPLARDGRFFASTLETGGHAASMMAVRDGAADVCAVDCVSHAVWQDDDPDMTRGLRVLARSPAAPGLPLITSLRTSDAEVSALRRALDAAALSPALKSANSTLRIGGFSILDVAEYNAVVEMEKKAIEASYPQLG